MVAQLLDTYMPYDSGPGSNVSEDGWRKFAKYFRGDGVIRGQGNELAVFGDSTGMQVKVPTGEVWIQGEWGQSSSQKILGIDTADGSLARKDLIVCRNDFVNNQMVIDKITGSPNASPVVPTPTQNTSLWEIQLGIVSVAAGASTITAGNVQALPQYTDGSAEYLKGGNQTVNLNTTTAVQWLTAVTPSSAVRLESNNSTFTFLRPGMWLITYGIEWNNNAGHTRWAWFSPTATPNAKRRGQSVIDQSLAGFHSNTGSAMVRVNANDQYSMFVFQDNTATSNVILGGATGTDFDASNVQLYWLGP